MKLTIEQALQQGVAAHNSGNLQEAERLYRAILQSQPTHPDANHNLGVLAVSVNKAEAALPLFKTAVEANPKIEQFWLSYINTLVKEKQFDKAKRALKKATKKGFSSNNFNILKTQLAFKKQIRNVKCAGPSPEQLSRLLDYYQTGQHINTEKLAASITEQFPEHPFAWKVLGATFGQTGRNVEAENANQTSVKLSPQDAEAHNNLGNILKELGRLEEAEASYKQAVALKIDYAEAHINLGATLKELGRLNEAEASYKQAITLKPNFAEAHNNLGNTLKELGRLDEAEASWNQAISLKPDYADALSNRWLLLFGQKRYEAALKDAELCIFKGATELDLTTLYALGRTEEIYKRIATQSKIDGENISIAAFAAFFSESEKTTNAYNFCPNPIDFIYISNLSCQLKDSTAYITELIKELNKVETIWEPPEKATKGGFQTLHGMNLFTSPSEKIAQLKSIIIEELGAYFLKFGNESCSYIQKRPPINNLFGWHVILKHQGHQSAHIHTGGWLSGVIYLKVVPSLGKDEGAIEFSLNGEHYHEDNSPRVTLQPQEGDIVFFPSSLHHKTIPFTTDADRIIVSFDLMPEATKR